MTLDRDDRRRILRPDLWRLESVTTACVVGAALVFAHLLKAFADLRPDVVDFEIFRRAAGRYANGRGLYDTSREMVNYLPPQFHILVVPFAAIAEPWAFIGWTALNACAAAATVWIAAGQAVEWNDARTRLTLATILLCAGTGAGAHLGQVSWIVALLLTLGWRAARKCHWRQGGWWLGIAVAVKPFLLIFLPVLAARRRWSCLAAVALACFASILLGAAVFGWSAVAEWTALLRAGAPPQQIRYFINASLSAVVARATVGAYAAMVISALLALLSVGAVLDADEDETWLVTIICALLASPLGWIYYLPLLTAPLIIVATEHRLPRRTWFAWPLLAVPPVSRDWFQAHTITALSVGSVYTWGLLWIWVCAVQAAVASGRGASERTRCGDSAARKSAVGSFPAMM